MINKNRNELDSTLGSPKFGILLFILTIIMWVTRYAIFSDDQVDIDELYQYKLIFFGIVTGTLFVASLISISIHSLSRVISDNP